MFVESMNEYLEILSGHVYDSDKVVTYKWLSKELEIHVNIAKQVLWEFWQRHKGENNIDCTVMLIGNLRSGGMRVEVVRESNLSVAKEKFSEIKSEHLYSVQTFIPDLESLATYDKGDIRFSAIQCKESIERTDEELSILRWGSLFKDHPFPKQEEKLKLIEKPKEVQTSEAPKNNQTSKKSANKKTTPVSQKIGFNNLFAKVSNKEKNSNVSSLNCTDTKKETAQCSVDKRSSSSTQSKSAITVKKDKKSLVSFFERSASVTKNVNSSSSVPKEEQVDANKKNNMKDNEKTQVIYTKSDSNNQLVEKTRGIKRNRSKESKHIVKKRKRIIVNDDLSDSQGEDEDMKSELEPESESEPEPEPELEVEIIQDKKEKSPPHIIHDKGKARVLKIVDKTYEEDGFLVTKKVHVYESCSEDETDIAEIQVLKKQDSPNIPKVPMKKKQTTLTNFFKKS